MSRKRHNEDDLNEAIKAQKLKDQLSTEQFWRDTFLHEPMPDDPNPPIQDYVYPERYNIPHAPGTEDDIPNRFDAVPGGDDDKKRSYYSPTIRGTLDAPNITFPEYPKIRI